MIFDRLNNAKQYYTLGEKVKKGFEFLLNSPLVDLNDGKYEILSDEIYANVQTLKTKNEKDKKWEVHRSYIDIQYVIKGEEKMGYGILEDFTDVVAPYDCNKDVAFLSNGEYNYINVKQGDFVMFYPNDVHAPMLSVKDDTVIKKVIVKIKI